MAAQQLRQQAAQLLAERDALAARCAAEGVLDEQFAQLLSLQDETNPDFVLEVVTLYFDDSAQKAQRIAALVGLDPSTGGGGGTEADFQALDALAHQFKGSSASLGARQVALACSSLRDACQARDLAAAQRGAHEVASALAAARARLEAVAALERQRKQVEQQAAAAGG
jgi:histidine-containing phosphotransfer protein